MDNNQNKNQKRDSFAKPGDESIVSGKSFFLSFGKQKKSSANPLIESEKNKNNKDNGKDNNKPANKDNNKPASKDNNKEAADRNNRAEKNNRNDRQKNADRDNKSTEKNDNRKDKGNFKNKNHNRTDKNRNEGKVNGAEAKPADNREEKNVSAQEERRTNQGGRNPRHGRNGGHKNQNNAAKEHSAEVNDIKEAKEPKEQQLRDERKFRDRKNGNDRRNDNNVPQEKNTAVKEKHDAGKRNIETAANDKQDRNPRQERQRPKHKKEKFVPTAPEQEITSEELLQPIVDRAGIVSAPRGFGIRGGKSSFLSSKDSALNDKDEPRYIDRNRPLAEQIIEQSKPKTYKNHVTENTETVEVIGIRFREAGKVYYFAPGENKVEKDTPVIVETARGVEYGFCAIANRHVSTDNIVPPLKPILRIATKDDTERYESNKQLEAGAAKIFREKVRALGLEMSLVYVEYTFDNGKLLFYFTADGRVDFRELIKELAAAFRTRIELRQIGVRDEAKIVGGLGICGRPVCCKSFLGEFSQVSIKMAKDQNLFINSSKISGTCGRFMCCIRYEDEVYQKEYERTPKVDAIVETPEGKGVVVESNALKGVVKVLLDDKPEELPKPYKCTEIKLLGYIKRENENELPEGIEVPDEGSGS